MAERANGASPKVLLPGGLKIRFCVTLPEAIDGPNGTTEIMEDLGPSFPARSIAATW